MAADVAKQNSRSADAAMAASGDDDDDDEGEEEDDDDEEARELNGSDAWRGLRTVAQMRRDTRTPIAAARDSLSQGIPFVLADPFRRTVVDRVVAADSDLAKMAKKWGSLILTSIGATVASQGLHNGQLRMQSDQSLTYARALRSLVNQFGPSFLWRGAEARVGLLLVVNVLNELILKPCWDGVAEE